MTVTAVFLVGTYINVKNSFIFSFLHLDPVNMVLGVTGVTGVTFIHLL